MTPSKFKASQPQSGQAAATSAAHVTSAPAKHRRFLIAQICNGGCSTVRLGPFRASEPDRPIPLEINQDLIRVQKVKRVFLAGRTEAARPTEPLEYKDIDFIHAMRSNLTSINECLSKTDLDRRMTAEKADLLWVTSKISKGDSGTPTDLLRKTLCRIFSSTDFDEGGRFYGAWWQNIKSWLRPAITINGQPTVECDFASLHPTMLYLERSLQVPDNPYAGILEAEQGQPQ